MRLIVAVLMALALFAGSANGQAITFTGDVPTDFAGITAIPDPLGDVGVPANLAGNVSGWDMEGVYVAYDAVSDTLFIGIDFNGIAGDADGDGDPSGTSAGLATNGGSDLPNLGNSEGITIQLDLDCDVNQVIDIVIGVPFPQDASGFQIANYNNTPLAPTLNFGVPIAGSPVTLFASPSAAQPDWEFSIANYSALAAMFPPAAGVTEIGIQAFAGSLDDDGIGEDYTPGFAQVEKIPNPLIAKLGDTVFNDLNANGVQDGGGEIGVQGVTVTLYDSTGTNALDTTTTDANGNYQFCVVPGTYVVGFSNFPSNFTGLTDQNQGGNDATDSDADPNTGLTGPITLGPAETNNTVDGGLLEQAKLGDVVFNDINGNGVQDGGTEVGVQGVTVNLLDSTGNTVLQTMMTDANGNYEFCVDPGTYVVEFTNIPSNFVGFTGQDQGGDDTADSDADTTTGRTGPITVGGGDNDPTNDAGLLEQAKIGDTVFNDLNCNGIQEGGDVGVSGVTITLFDATGTNVVATTMSGANGFYQFCVAPGTYVLGISGFDAGMFISLTPSNQGGSDTVDSDFDPTSMTTGQVTVQGGDVNNTVDAGLKQFAKIGDTVFNDLDCNGIQDTGDEGVAGIMVTLYDPTGTTVLATMMTDASGNYEFCVAPGTYVVGVSGFDPTMFVSLTPADQGGDDGADSDVDPTTMMTDPITVNGGDVNDTVDAGLKEFAKIGDTVFNDENCNGILDGNDAGVGGVTVTLYDSTGTNVLATMMTDSNGNYEFCVAPGTYVLGVSGFDATMFVTLSPADQGGDDTADSDFDPTTMMTGSVTVAGGDVNSTVDAGLKEFAKIGDTVFNDLNGNGVQDGGSEIGVPNVTVTLYDSTGMTALMTAMTDANGDYLFCVAPGTYVVGFSNFPSNFTGLTGQDQGGDDTADSDADPMSGLTGPITVASGDNDLTNDAGLLEQAKLGNFVFNDLDGDGVQGGTEPGVGGVTVNLLDDTGANVLQTLMTAPDGSYEFCVDPGTYIVEFTNFPSNFTGLTGQDQGGDDAADSDADTTNGRTGPITVAGGDNDDTNDAGLLEQAKIGDLVFDDRNCNGIQDTGDNGVGGIMVTLYDATGTNVLQTATTGTDGSYEFCVDPGTYVVGISGADPSMFVGISPANQGGNGSVDSDVDPTSMMTNPITVQGGDNNDTVDAGLKSVAKIGDLVFNDPNCNGIQDTGEGGIAGIMVTLYDATGTNALMTDTTDMNGNYQFCVAPGTYVIGVSGFDPMMFVSLSPADQGGDDAADSDVDPTTMMSGPVTVLGGDVNNTVDAGLKEFAKIGDTVFNDENCNGILDGNDGGVGGVTVTLYDSTGTNVIATMMTDVNGNYQFCVPPGTYVLGISGFDTTIFVQLSPADQGGDDTADSDFDPTTAMTDPITVNGGDVNNDVDGGLKEFAKIGDLVFNDLNGNGVQDGSGEVGVPNVTVTLFDSTGMTTLMTAMTDSNGEYLFCVAPGTYVVGFSNLPTGFTGLTDQDQGGDDTADSDADPNTGLTGPITVASGDDDRTNDTGILQVAKLGNFVFNDLDGDGVQGGTEPGVGGVTVNLLDSTGTTVLQTVMTMPNGMYEFCVEPGTYVVEFTNFPSNFTGLTGQDQGGDDATDSDADTTSGRTGPITVAGGDNDDTNDAGLLEQAKIGDFVFNDHNCNGIQDTGDEGLGGVMVTLYDATGTTALDTITTDSMGGYEFCVNPGTYVIGVGAADPTMFVGLSPANQGGDDDADSDVDPTTMMSGPVTVQGGDDDDSVDAGFKEFAKIGDTVFNDLNCNGIQDMGDGGVAGITVTLFDATGTNTLATAMTDANGNYEFCVAPGTYVIGISGIDPTMFVSITPADQGGDDAADSDVDPTTMMTDPITVDGGDINDMVDAGLKEFAKLGDTVFNDLNADGIQDMGEPGVAGVTVTLYDSTGTMPMATMMTDGGGNYEFCVAPGTYVVGFSNFPSNFIGLTMNDQGGDDTADSDADPMSGLTGPITLQGGDNDPTNDAGLIEQAKIGDTVFNDLNCNGIQDMGDTGVAGITVTLFDSTGTMQLQTAQTGSMGEYEFCVAPGTYVLAVSGIDPTMFVSLSPANQGGDDSLDSNFDPTTMTSGPVTVQGGDVDDTVDAGLKEFAKIGDTVFNDLDCNGIQDGGDEGVAGITVTLYDSTATMVLSTMMTDAMGNYEFCVAPGTYVLGISGIDPTMFVSITPADQGGDDSADSDVDPMTAMTDPITVDGGDVNDTVDAGLKEFAKIGDRVYNDTNCDGIQNGGEMGVAGTTVTLYDSTGTMALATMMTDTMGNYEFCVAPGTYVLGISFDPTMFDGLTPMGMGGDDMTDSDFNETTLMTDPITVNGGDVNDTVDAGLCECIGSIAEITNVPCGFSNLDPVLTVDPFVIGTQPKFTFTSDFPNALVIIFFSLDITTPVSLNGCLFTVFPSNGLFSLTMSTTDANGDFCYTMPFPVPASADGACLGFQSRVCAPASIVQGPFFPIPDLFSNGFLLKVGECPPTP